MPIGVSRITAAGRGGDTGCLGPAGYHVMKPEVAVDLPLPCDIEHGGADVQPLQASRQTVGGRNP